jgi:hypothetical protein
MGYSPHLTSEAMQQTENNSYVENEVARFADAVAAALKAKWSYKRRNSVWIYRENEIYALGFVGYGDFTDKANGNVAYIVHSRNIENCRYNDYNAQHYMAFAKHFEKGLANATRHLRTRPCHVAVEAERRNLRRQMQEIDDYSSRKVRQLANSVTDDLSRGNNSPLEQEFRNLVNMGHTWLDANFGEKVKAFINYRDEDTSSGKNIFTAVYINISPRGTQSANVYTNMDGKEWNWNPDTSNHYGCDVDQLDEELKRKVFTLQMVEQGTFVPNVGFHALAGRLFYVAQT